MSLQDQLNAEIEELENGLRNETEASEEQPGDGQGQFEAGNEGGNALNEPEDDAEADQPDVSALQKKIDDLNKALNSERAQRRMASREADELRELRAKVDQLAEKAKPADEDQKPDREKNPLAYLEWLDRKVTQYEQTEQQKAQLQEQQQRYYQQVEQIQRYGQAAEDEFRAQAPDYDDAFRFFVEKRVAMAKAMGYDEASATDVVRNELLGTVYQHQQAGANPAASIYNAAKALGFSGPARTAKRGTQTPTLPNGGRPAKQNGVSLEALETATGEEFDRLWAEAEKAGLLQS